MTSSDTRTISELELCVIGAGNLGSALVRGFAKEGGPKAIRVCSRTQSKIDALSDVARVSGSTDLAAMTAGADVILIAVKPKDVATVLETLAGVSQGSPLFVTVAAGIETAQYLDALPDGARVARAMPNVASQIGVGLTGFYAETDLDASIVEQLFSLVGLVSRVAEEDLLDAIIGISASAQAFVCEFIQALADGGVSRGLTLDESQRIAAQTALGASMLVLQGRDPREVVSSIATPGGTTVAGLDELKKRHFSETVVAAVQASADKSRKLRG